METRRSRRTVLAGMAGAVVAPAAVLAQKGPHVDAGVNGGLEFLRKTQDAEGSWQQYPGVTSVAVLGFLRNGKTEKDPAVAKACAYLASLAKPNGAIYTDQYGPAQALPNYNTSLALTALHATKNPKYAAIVKKAQEFLVGSQYDEGEGFTPKDHQYGGIGYGSKKDNPDLSNLQNALEALRESGYPMNAEVFKKAITFLQRVQNRKDSNDQDWAANDGGFIYAASGESKVPDGGHSSYGSMTYAGLKSYLYCSVTKSDPRVQAALAWLKGNYDVEQNPKMGSDGLYYYYHTMTKTLNVWGDKVFVDSAGKKHPWGADVAGAILKRQKPDGSWQNTNPRWWEDRPELATGYDLISL
jgi:squalene-hopene/tetraprenyl-beta-curcumene cyclase